MRDDILLDTEGACFLCLKKDSSRDNEGSGDDSNGKIQVCLRYMCRFLDIKPVMVLVRGFKDVELNDKEKNDPVFTKDVCDFSVMLCVRCTTLVEKLSNLIKEMEVLQLLIRNELQVFQGTLEGSMSRWEQVQEEMVSGDSDPEKIRTVEHLRHLAKEKGSLKSKQLEAHSVPRVLLNRVKVSSREGIVNNQDLQSKTLRREELVTPSTIPDADDLSTNKGGNEMSISSDSEHEDFSPPTSPSSFDPDSSPTSPQSSNSSCKEDDQPSTSGHSPLNNLHLKEPYIYSKEVREHFHEVTGTNNQSQCSLCSKILTSDSKVRHLVNFHLELLFPTPPSISKDTVRDHCKQILLSETKRSNSLAQERLKASENWKENRTSFCFCHLCNRFFHKRDSFKWHFVISHYSVFQKKLDVSLGDTSSSDVDKKLFYIKLHKKNVQENRGRSKYPFVCEISNRGCGKGFSSKSVLQKHMKGNCVFRESRSRTNYICRKEDGGCGLKFAHGYNLGRHKLFSCPNRGEKMTLICKLEDGGCGKRFSSDYAYKRHVHQRCQVLVNKPRKKAVRKKKIPMAFPQPTKKVKKKIDNKGKNPVPIVANGSFHPLSSGFKMEVEENNGALEPHVHGQVVGKSENVGVVEGQVSGSSSLFVDNDDLFECRLEIKGDVKQVEMEGIFPDI